MEGRSGSETRLLVSRDIRLNACKFDNSLAISAGEEGEEPSSSSSNPERGMFDRGAPGDGARIRSRVDDGLLEGGVRVGEGWEFMLSEEREGW